MQRKKELRDTLYERDGHVCHYCGIQEADFLRLWGKFYGLPYRGQTLEVERKETVVIKGNGIVRIDREYTLENCVLACALCNMAKSDMFTYDEFKKVGKVIEEIWQKRKISRVKVKIAQDQT
jgi:hypothetical protein